MQALARFPHIEKRLVHLWCTRHRILPLVKRKETSVTLPSCLQGVFTVSVIKCYMVCKAFSHPVLWGSHGNYYCLHFSAEEVEAEEFQCLAETILLVSGRVGLILSFLIAMWFGEALIPKGCMFVLRVPLVSYNILSCIICFNWKIIALQCCVGFCCTTAWIG